MRSVHLMVRVVNTNECVIEVMELMNTYVLWAIDLMLTRILSLRDE
jgi:hypothetical protein